MSNNPLWDYLHENHGLTLLESELEDIRQAVSAELCETIRQLRNERTPASGPAGAIAVTREEWNEFFKRAVIEAGVDDTDEITEVKEVVLYSALQRFLSTRPLVPASGQMVEPFGHLVVDSYTNTESFTRLPRAIYTPREKWIPLYTSAPTLPALSDEQILALAIDGGIYDCLSDQYIMGDGRDSLEVDLVRFARKLLAATDAAPTLPAHLVAVNRSWLSLARCPDRYSPVHNAEPCQWCEELKAALSGSLAFPTHMVAVPRDDVIRFRDACDMVAVHGIFEPIEAAKYRKCAQRLLAALSATEGK